MTIEVTRQELTKEEKEVIQALQGADYHGVDLEDALYAWPVDREGKMISPKPVNINGK